MFWGLLLKANKKYTQKIAKSFHVSQAALDITNCSDDPIQVMLGWDNKNYILCTLRKGKTEQVPLDLNFAEGDEISFTSQGNANVHLAGYFITDPDEFNESSEESESEGELEIADQKLDNNKKRSLMKDAKKSSPASAEPDSSDAESDDVEESDESAEEEQPEPEVKRPKFDKSKSIENGKGPKKDKSNTKNTSITSIKTLRGGLRAEELNVGNGAEAKPGRKVQVYYEGRLQSNNKVFDSSKQGAGFKFVLGRGEVIKGWDVGVEGMKVGGRRRIICPPGMAYGSRGSPPAIPPNSTLVFDIELKAVH